VISLLFFSSLLFSSLLFSSLLFSSLLSSSLLFSSHLFSSSAGVGRAGRDGEEACCLAFLADSDIPALRRYSKQLNQSAPLASSLLFYSLSLSLSCHRSLEHASYKIEAHLIVSCHPISSYPTMCTLSFAILTILIAFHLTSHIVTLLL
jgi:hypothetical protein